MKPSDPNMFATVLPTLHRQWVQSIQQTLESNVDMGTPTSKDTTSTGVNSGVYTKFNRGNGSGTLVRIAANGVSETGAPYNWAATGTGVPIQHGLGRQPIGFHVVDADKSVQVYRTAAPDSSQITLTSTDNTASVTVYIF